MNTTTAEPFFWAYEAVPILALFVIIDLVWLVALIVRRNWSSVRLLALVAIVWVVAIAVDFYHH